MPSIESAFCDGITRRGLIQTGLGGLISLTLPDLLRMRAEASLATKAVDDTAVIYLELAGGPTQHETYDPKPEAPKEYRGPLSTIASSLPGVQFSQLMSEQSKIASKLAIVRSIHHDSGSHETSSHLVQTGYYLQNRQNRDNEMPCFGSVAARMRGAVSHGLPPFVSLPQSMRYGRAGYLNKGCNPFETMADPSAKKFAVQNLTLQKGVTAERIEDRRHLLDAFEASRRLADTQGVVQAMDQFSLAAFEMVTGKVARAAFRIDSEDSRTRDTYGRNATGQNLLLARRLVEHGVAVVTVRVTGWDDHNDLARGMRQKGPAYDRGLAALVQDLHDRGLSRRVLVVAMGEFGRTPRINENAGRDHWGQVMSVLFAGGGLRTGQVIGASDRLGAVPVERAYRPENVLAMIYRHLGIDSNATFADNSGRPRYILERRELISELL